jgi:DNA-binding transcriptional LysR family regulator
MDDYGTLVLPPVLKSFSTAYRGIELQMETGLTSGMIARVGRSLVLAMHARGAKSGALLRREQALWAGVDGMSPHALDPLPVALYPPGCLFRQWAVEALEQARRRWRLAFVSHSLAAVEAIAAQGLAVTIVKESTVPRSLFVLDPEAGLPLLPCAEIRLHAASSLDAPARLLVQHMREHLGTGRSPPRSSR